MKSSRHAAILKLIQEQNIANQGDLTLALSKVGFNAAQSTVSRDIRELGLSLERHPKGLRYAAPSQRTMDMLLRDSMVSVASAGNILVVRTRSGMAMAVALAIDEMEFKEVLGCVAGDDTVICVVRTEAEAVELRMKLEI